jgi:hypothetical protein
MQVGADRQAGALHRLLVGDDGKVKRLLQGRELVQAAGGHAHRRRRADPAARADRRARPCHGLGLGALQLDLTGTRSLAELQQRLRAMPRPTRPAVDHRPRLEPGAVAGQALSRPRRPRRGGEGPAGVAGAGRRPCLGRQQRGAAAAGSPPATKAPTGGKIEKDRRAASRRPVRRRRDGAGRQACAAADRRDARRRAGAAQQAAARAGSPPWPTWAPA